MQKKIRVAVIGGNGYGGIELIRLLLGHDQVELSLVVSRSQAGKKITQVFPHLIGSKHSEYLQYVAPDQASWDNIDVCFFATPHATAMNQVDFLYQKGIKIIDLSADFRLKDILKWEQWYGTRHVAPEYIKKAVYGLPEINREQIKTADIIACPGCYPTSVQLGLLPLLKSQLITGTIIADVKSGISGAGRSAKTNMLYCERSENFEAYASQGHRHLPEIEQQIQIIGGNVLPLVFTPHLIPSIRGIHATIYVKLINPTVDIQSLYEEQFEPEPFVYVLPYGEHPNTRSVSGTNFVHIAIAKPLNHDVATIFVVEDNLIKGAAGQAVQCMNIRFGLQEKSALEQMACI